MSKDKTGIRAGKKFNSRPGITKQEIEKLAPALQKLRDYDKANDHTSREKDSVNG